MVWNFTKEDPHISYSEAKLYHFCPWRYKIEYRDGNKEPSNIHLVFGKFIHTLVQKQLNREALPEIEPALLETFNQEGVAIPEPIDVKRLTRASLVLLAGLPEALDQEIPSRQFLTAEDLLLEEMPPFPKLKFKGYIDAIFEADKKIIVCDWKVTSWGWNGQKRADPELHYQLVLYQFFWALKNKINPEDIKLYFVLLKHAAKPGKEIEFIPIKSGKKKILNALTWLSSAVNGIHKQKIFYKNRENCDRCPWKHTIQCPGLLGEINDKK